VVLTAGLLVTAAALALRGGFFLPEAAWLPAALVAAAVARAPSLHPAARAPLAAAGLLAGWWTAAAVGWGDLEAAAPLLGSVVGFGAALALGSAADDAGRALVHRSLVGAGAVLAAVGIVGYALRLTSLSTAGGGPWRLLSTLTYQNAAGIVLAALASLAVTMPGVRPATRRVAVTLLLVALAATFSRGAFLAALAALPLLPRRTLAGAAWPASMAACASVVCLATSGRDGVQLVVIVAAVAACALSAGGSPRWLRGRTRVAAVLVAAGAATAAVVAATPELAERTSDEFIVFRLEAWEAALGDLRDHPVVGAGPERPVTFDDGTRARFAHNDYLQVAAGAGVVGIVLLAGLFVGVGRAVSRRDETTSAAVAALVVVAVGGLVDFTWHLPAVGMVAGWAAALALERGRTDSFDDARLVKAEGERGSP
jgi:O-antigen ligase